MNHENEESALQVIPPRLDVQAAPRDRVAKAADAKPAAREHFITEWAAHHEPAAGR